jgi:hypothetical protein
MARISDLREHWSDDKIQKVIFAACMVAARFKKKCTVIDIQNALRISYHEAEVIHDFLSDTYLVEARVSTHWIRSARRYVRNNPHPSLAQMCARLDVGDRRGQLLMLELAKRKIVRIKEDFSFEHAKPMATFMELVGQMKVVAKKYNGRCEPELLVRTLFLDETTAFRLAQYGEEVLGLTWRRRSTVGGREH